MRLAAFGTVLAAMVSAACAIGACSSDSGAPTDPSSPGADGGTTEGGPNVDGADVDGALGDSARDAPTDGASNDASTDADADAALPDDSGVILPGDPPAVQTIGRFENDGVGANVAFPGSKIVARFNGTDAVVKLSQTDGFSGGPSWFNVVLDGVLQPKLMVSGASVDYPVVVNRAAGVHVVELEKRTEGNLGVVRYEGFTFPNGGVLLAPPARPSRRVEFLSDSTIDGFGIEGDRVNAGAANYCGVFGAPAQFNNARKSMAALTAASLSADHYLIAYSGKGLTKNGDPGDTLLFQTLYDRALPDRAASAWGFAWKPDAVVISLGGVDFDGLIAEPAGFTAAYGGLVDKVRGHYPGAWIFLTVWSQIKDDNILTRSAMRASLQGIISARPADLKLSYFQFPEANVDTQETGCQYHGNEAHHATMAALLTTELKSKLGW